MTEAISEDCTSVINSGDGFSRAVSGGSQEALSSSTFGQSETPTQTPTRPPVPSPKSGSSDVENFYLEKWYTCVVGCLPPIFRDITMAAGMPDFPPLWSAICAISASYLAHIESSIVITNAGGRRSRYVPQSEHRYRSLEFYDRGVRELTRLVSTSKPADIHYVLATSLIFHYFEIDSGSVVGAGGHMESIDSLVMSSYDVLHADLTGQKLLCTWMVLRGVVASRRLSVGLGLTGLSSSISSDELDYIMSTAATPYDSIMRLLLTSLSLVRVMILDWCVCRGASFVTPEEKHAAFAGVLDKLSLPESRRDCSSSELAAIDDGYWKSLAKQRAKLDDWHSRLPMSELPTESFTSQNTDPTTADTTTAAADPDVEPLRFQTHEAAMNYIYYALAQMLSSRRALAQVATADAPPAKFTTRNYPWEHLILRITMGLDLSDCVTKHTFRVGVMSVLSTCAAWCPHIAVTQVAERWLAKLEACGMAVEDGMPVAVIKRELNFVVENKKKDQDIFRISVLTSADTETRDVYQSDFQMLSAVCAKDRRTGKLYNDIQEIP
ncbi:hypothetical protein A1O3_02997 [Capronia epimyces CBS 606.96]|uniref:Transcription factor domain-containing protein n=1 Tax=Capronia epimyces CBS 606.96 TaxID=1182542 RepID=W9YJT6_9EURO|nr:uncharacterized protein A1O3_02997 [Capronia epimyces CBS 606.96]EXJ89930.1 hypothetical protein A1O3_02997 [Capronia epimyces CBS 606.96]